MRLLFLLRFFVLFAVVTCALGQEFLAVSPASAEPLDINPELRERALETGWASAYGLGYWGEPITAFRAGDPVFIRDLVQVSPADYARLYSSLFAREEQLFALELSRLDPEARAARLASWSLRDTVNAALDNILSQHGGVYEVSVYHAEGCAVSVSLQVLSGSQTSATGLAPGSASATYCPGAMLSAAQIKAVMGNTLEPQLVSFRYTRARAGTMWVIGTLAVDPYTGAQFRVTDTNAIAVDPLAAGLYADYTVRAEAVDGQVVRQHSFELAVELEPLTVASAQTAALLKPDVR